MAAAANFPSSTQDTYTLANISPQNHAMNLSIWSQIEDFCRRVADRAHANNNNNKNSHSTTYVMTGPLWLPTTRRTANEINAQQKVEYVVLGTGDSLVHVPTHFFKIIVVVENSTGKSVINKFACFLVPNVPPQKVGMETNLKHFIVHWHQLETISGLRFFPSLTSSQWKADAKQVTKAILRKGTSRSNVATQRKNSSIRPGVSLATQLQHLTIN